MRILDRLGDIKVGSVANMQKLKVTYAYVTMGIMLATFGLGLDYNYYRKWEWELL